MRIACLGDSCTFGQNVRADQAWPHLLWQMTGHDVRNLGVNGDTTRLGLERFHRDVDLLEPDVVVLQFGHNDINIWHGFPRTNQYGYRSNMLELQDRAVRVSSRMPIILWPHPAVPPKDEAYNERRAAYLPGYVLDEELLTVPILADGYGVHPDPEGHRMYAEYVAGQL